MELLPKGLPVVFVCKAIPDLEKDKQDDEANGIKSHRFRNLSFIPGFVAGDTEKDGFSIVALDNPELCLVSSHLSPVTTARRRQMILETGCLESEDESFLLGYRDPVCQFS